MGPATPDYLDANDPFYDAFKRTDAYGTRGKKPQPVLEYVRLIVLASLLLPVRIVSVLFLVVYFHLVCRFSAVFPPENRAANLVAGGKWTSRLALLAFGYWKVKWEKDSTPYQQQIAKEKGKPLEVPPEGKDVSVGAVIGNHISYLDILVHLTRAFPSFVARGNTKDLPLIGLISQHLQCVYVNREFTKGEGEVKGVSAQVKERMELAASQGSPSDLRPLLLFPEGTTTNGTGLLPFKTGAFLAGAPVLPVLLRYGPDRVSAAWESIDAPWHAFLLLANPFHSVTATELPVYIPSKEEKADPKLYASNVRELMLRAGHLKPSEASLVDSRAYIALCDGKQPPPNSRAGMLLAERGGTAQHAGAEGGKETKKEMKKET